MGEVTGNVKQMKQNQTNLNGPNMPTKSFQNIKKFIPENVPMGQGTFLSIIYLIFASIVAISTYYLNSIANIPIYFGVVMEAFDYNQWNVPVNTLLQGNGFVFTNYSSQPIDGTISLSDLLYKNCGMNDQSCNLFLGNTNQIWSAVGKSFSSISNFDLPKFQNSNQIINFKHINNLSGWNKAVVQFSIDNYDMAITCMVRRTSFYLTQELETNSIVDTLAYCSKRKYDPNWICENQVDLDINTYAIQVNKGIATYIGVTKRGEIYLNAGKTAQVSGGLSGSYFLRTVPAIDEYMGGIIQASAPWDILGVSQCYNYDFNTKLGFLLQIQGVVTMKWKCDSLMVTNSIVLWGMSIYLVALQILFLRHSVICSVPVYMSKNIIGLAILFVAFYGNENLQTLSTFLIQNHVGNFPSQFYSLCGPAQVASIVGIMTGTIIQIWFNPLIVTQTWLLMLFSFINWIVVFLLEGFIFPYQNENIPSMCGLPTSTSCFLFNSISKTYYLSAIISGIIIIVAIIIIYLHGKYYTSSISIPITNSALDYLNVPDFNTIVTTTNGCVRMIDGTPGIDVGILLIKNMLHVSDNVMTRISNVQYELIYRFTPNFLRKIFSHSIGTILIYQVKDGKITRNFKHKYLHEMEIGEN